MARLTHDTGRHRVREPHRRFGQKSAVLAGVAGAAVIIATILSVGALGSDESPTVLSDDSSLSEPAPSAVDSAAPSAEAVEKVRSGKATLPKYKVAKEVRIRTFNKEELAAQAAKAQAEQEARERARLAEQSLSFRIGTFNVLGSQHTVPGGPRSGAYPPWPTRSGGAIGLIRDHGVDVLGAQEVQADQLNSLRGGTGMAAFPGYEFGDRETDNSIFYDTSVFEFVSGSSFTIRFMNGDHPQTILRLRHKATGREMYFVNMHASAGGGQYAVSRRSGHLAAVANVNRLKAEGLPVFLMGDMNDRAEFFCRVAPPTGLVAAIGGSTSGGCSPAGALAVDWVLGTGGVSFEGYREDRSPLGRVSDHHFVSATANIAPAG